MTKQIQLTQGQVAIVDDEDFDFINQWKWTAQWNPHTKSFYAFRNPVIFPGVRRKTYMARIIMNTSKGLVCDHISHDTLDNRKENLRNITISQNGMNRIKPASGNRTGLLGIGKVGKYFRASISIDKKRVRLSVRRTVEEAIKDRKDAEEKHYEQYRGNK